MSRSYTSSPPSASMACRGTALLYFTFSRGTESVHAVKKKILLHDLTLSGVGHMIKDRPLDMVTDAGLKRIRKKTRV
jgi:hypothetical protein